MRDLQRLESTDTWQERYGGFNHAEYTQRNSAVHEQTRFSPHPRRRQSQKVKEKSEALSEERIFPEMAPRPKHSISSGLS